MIKRSNIVLEDILDRGKNNLDIIRLIAAIAVIFGHSFALFDRGGHVEPIANICKKLFSRE